MELRRTFLKKALYITPLIMTVKVRVSRANSAYDPDDPPDDPGDEPGTGGNSLPIIGTRGWAADYYR